MGVREGEEKGYRCTELILACRTAEFFGEYLTFRPDSLYEEKSKAQRWSSFRVRMIARCLRLGWLWKILSPFDSGFLKPA